MTANSFFTTIILTLILVVSIYDFYNLFFREHNIISKKCLFFSIYIYFFTSIAMNVFGTSVHFNMPMSYILFFVVALNYKASIISKLFGSFLCTTIFIAFELLAVYIAGSILDVSNVELLGDPVIELFLFSLSRFIPFTILKILKFLYSKRGLELQYNLNLAEWGIIITLPSFSFVLMCLMCKTSESSSGAGNPYISVSILLVLFLNIIFYSVYTKTLKLAETEAALMLQERQNQYYSSQYDELKMNLDEVHKFKHNTKHILVNAITELSEENNIEINSLLYGKLDKIIDDFYLETYKCYTGNSSLDMILNYQVTKAEKYNIELSMQISPDLKVNIEGKVLAIILGNALDNAIEACQKHDKKEIAIVLLNQNGNFYLSISNEYEGKLKYQDGLPVTSKENPKVHGVGLGSIKQLVESNHAFMVITTENNKFILQITFTNR